MLDWLNDLTRKTDHPMHNVAAARKLLSGLPGDPVKALEEAASWLTTVTGAAGFRLANRIGVVKLLDETGQPLEPQLNRLYLTSPTLKEFARLHVWQVMLEFWERLADAYRLCLDELLRDPGQMSAHAAELPLLITRTLRALTNQMKVLHLRYLPVREKLWQPLYGLYLVSEENHCDTGRVKVYAGEELPSSPHQELLRALMLDAASPESMQPRQIELAARVAARLADSFLFKTRIEPGCNWYVDLAQPHRPSQVTAASRALPSVRFFGGGIVIAKMEEVVRRLLEEPDEKEKRFGDDYPPHEKLLVLKHLICYWNEHPPHRREARHSVKAELAVVHGFKAACQTVQRVEFSGMGEITRDMDVKVKEKLGLNLAADAAAIPQEKWLEQNAGNWGLGMDIPRASESWVTIGTLCALRSGERPWWVGVVRRLYRDSETHEHAGIEVLAKKPTSIWLRGVGEGAMRAENWATSSGSFQYDYLNVILLGESASQQPELLLAHGSFFAGTIYEALMGDKPHLRFEELLEQSNDFDRVRFTWMTHNPHP